MAGGAPGPIRTADTRFRRAVLCPLSYGGVVAIVALNEPQKVASVLDHLIRTCLAQPLGGVVAPGNAE